MNNKKKRMAPLFISVFAFLILAGITSKAQAEYYLVYPGNSVSAGGGCGSGCCNRVCARPYIRTNVHCLQFVSPRRHADYGSGEMAPYAWITAP